VVETNDAWLALYIILVFVVLISGLFLGASFFSAPEAQSTARLAAAPPE
jgi:hypothetical protein